MLEIMSYMLASPTNLQGTEKFRISYLFFCPGFLFLRHSQFRLNEQFSAGNINQACLHVVILLMNNILKINFSRNQTRAKQFKAQCPCGEYINNKVLGKCYFLLLMCGLARVLYTANFKLFLSFFFFCILFFWFE